ncbi:MAG: hypothetical protein JXO22_06390, partial [Phycisphaerae bacterium]|nr:hypothetical protein [Phycisphaerae bacterium]
MTTEPNAQSDTTASKSGTPTAETPAAGGAKPPRKRRWRRRLLFIFGGLFLILVILVVAAPTIVSSKGITDYALARVSASLRGEIQAGGLSVSWFGPIQVSDALVRDAAQRDVLRVKHVNVGAGLWQLVTGGLALGEIRIDEPQVLVHFDEQNNVSIADAFQSAQPTAAEPASQDKGSLPDVQGRLVIKNGTVRLERDGRDPYAITALGADVNINS